MWQRNAKYLLPFCGYKPINHLFRLTTEVNSSPVYSINAMTYKTSVQCTVPMPWHTRPQSSVQYQCHGIQDLSPVYSINAMTYKTSVQCTVPMPWHTRPQSTNAMAYKTSVQCTVPMPWHTRPQSSAQYQCHGIQDLSLVPWHTTVHSTNAMAYKTSVQCTVPMPWHTRPQSSAMAYNSAQYQCHGIQQCTVPMPWHTTVHSTNAMAYKASVQADKPRS